MALTLLSKVHLSTSWCMSTGKAFTHLIFNAYVMWIWFLQMLSSNFPDAMQMLLSSISQASKQGLKMVNLATCGFWVTLAMHCVTICWYQFISSHYQQREKIHQCAQVHKSACWVMFWYLKKLVFMPQSQSYWNTSFHSGKVLPNYSCMYCSTQ